jgi:hypothetical protein
MGASWGHKGAPWWQQAKMPAKALKASQVLNKNGRLLLLLIVVQDYSCYCFIIIIIIII